MYRYLVEFAGGDANGMRRHYDTKKAAVIAAKAYVRQNRDCPGELYAEIYAIDNTYKSRLISTVE